MSLNEGIFTLSRLNEYHIGKYALFVVDDTRSDLSILGVQGWDEHGSMVLPQINDNKIEIPLWVGRERYSGNDTVITKPIPRKGRAWYELERSHYTRDFSRVLLWICENGVIKSLGDDALDGHYTHFKTMTFVNGNAEALWGGRGHMY